MDYGLPKHSRLCGQQKIATLYKEGKHFVAWPLRVTYMPTDSETQVLVWAPKSLFKHAVQRNRLRRLMREAYRRHPEILSDPHFRIAFNYIDKEEQPYTVVEKAVCKALKKISGK